MLVFFMEVTSKSVNEWFLQLFLAQYHYCSDIIWSNYSVWKRKRPLSWLAEIKWIDVSIVETIMVHFEILTSLRGSERHVSVAIALEHYRVFEQGNVSIYKWGVICQKGLYRVGALFAELLIFEFCESYSFRN